MSNNHPDNKVIYFLLIFMCYYRRNKDKNKTIYNNIAKCVSELVMKWSQLYQIGI